MHIRTIAGATLVEARRNHLTAMLLVAVLVGMLAAEFTASLAITDSAGYRATVFAALLRLVAVVGLGLFVVSSVLREFDDKQVEALLAMHVTRSSYILGRLLGFAVLAVVIAAAAFCALLVSSAPLAALSWAISLACELLLVAAAGLLLALTLNQATAALVVLLAGYALARTLDAIRLLGENPLAGSGGWTEGLVRGLIEAIAFVFPSLGRFTQSAWLQEPIGSLQDMALLVAPVMAQTVVYGLLLTAAAVFDLHRRQL